jgi:ribosomal protein S9
VLVSVRSGYVRVDVNNKSINDISNVNTFRNIYAQPFKIKADRRTVLILNINCYLINANYSGN